MSDKSKINKSKVPGNKEKFKFKEKSIGQILVEMLKSAEGQKIIEDLSATIPELAALKFKGMKP